MTADARELAATFDLEKLTAEFYANPYPTYRALRETEPVKRLPNGSYFLTRYNDLVAAYKNTKTFSSDKKKEFAEFNHVVQKGPDGSMQLRREPIVGRTAALDALVEKHKYLNHPKDINGKKFDMIIKYHG